MRSIDESYLGVLEIFAETYRYLQKPDQHARDSYVKALINRWGLGLDITNDLNKYYEDKKRESENRYREIENEI